MITMKLLLLVVMFPLVVGDGNISIRQKRSDDISTAALEIIMQQQAALIQQQGALIQQLGTKVETLQAKLTTLENRLPSTFAPGM